MSRDWRDHTKCRDVDPRVFVSSGNGDNMIEAKRWTPQAIGLRVGLEVAVVYRILKEFRESGEAA